MMRPISLQALVAVALCVTQVLATSCHDSDAGTCLAADATHSPPPASLLQVRRNAASVSLHHEDTVAGQCTGVTANDKCWHLSQVGQSCAATCARYSEAFSFIMPNKDEPPMMQALLEANASVQQQPWAALECHVPGEERYFPASADAAKHYAGDLGTWSHTQCSLACPCSSHNTECKWKQTAACTPQFEYKGAIIHGCATADHDTPWCQHHFHRTDEANISAFDWSSCHYDCGPDRGAYSTENGCEWTPDVGCASEFDYEGTHFIGCTAMDHDTPWCSASDTYAGAWYHCSYSCPANAGTAELVERINANTMLDNVLCTFEKDLDCAEAFVYKGVNYTGCAEVDHPTPWCSLNGTHRGSWTVCKEACTLYMVQPEPPTMASSTLAPFPPTTSTFINAVASTTMASQLVSTTITPSSMAEATTTAAAAPAPALAGDDACAKRPEAENDVVGSSVSLDEDGYTTLAELDSPSNMKRYICRIVGKIECKVIDDASLDGFVPFYSGAVSHQTYEHLEQELSLICHMGGKWVVPAEEPISEANLADRIFGSLR